MFYRLKVDGFVGGILKRSGYDTTMSLNFWPVGATMELVQRGKAKGWKPVEAAALGICDIVLERLAVGQLTEAEARQIVARADQVAREHGARQPVIEHLSLVIFRVIPEVAKDF